LCDEFSIRLRAVAFPIQRGIEPTNVEARHLWPPTRVPTNATSQKCQCKRQNTSTIYVRQHC
jgi:hypothetical protein